ncbi:MAG: hypothetical protein EON58_09550 [Alphaproteobacteria bacterium]|nr:MAG: hypothetical protein EON58_09550 [Alphaproteobacteria bacterium]
MRSTVKCARNFYSRNQILTLEHFSTELKSQAVGNTGGTGNSSSLGTSGGGTAAGSAGLSGAGFGGIDGLKSGSGVVCDCVFMVSPHPCLDSQFDNIRLRRNAVEHAHRRANEPSKCYEVL